VRCSDSGDTRLGSCLPAVFRQTVGGIPDFKTGTGGHHTKGQRQNDGMCLFGYSRRTLPIPQILCVAQLIADFAGVRSVSQFTRPSHRSLWFSKRHFMSVTDHRDDTLKTPSFPILNKAVNWLDIFCIVGRTLSSQCHLPRLLFLLQSSCRRGFVSHLCFLLQPRNLHRHCSESTCPSFLTSIWMGSDRLATPL